MVSERLERRLSAILAADVAGYSRLIGEDEAGTTSSPKAICATLIDPEDRGAPGPHRQDDR